MIRQLTPEYVIDSPLPQAVLVDQVGSVLALIAGDAGARPNADLLKKIHDCIRQRCSEPQLTAADVAASLQLPPKIVHRTLAASHQTFASQLLNARVEIALRLLGTPSSGKLTTVEIARRSGFVDEAHFARVMRRRTGHRPAELRQMVD
jgi:AraC-like DNA-binding protein